MAFDLETTGKYPLESEICEVAAVKWQGGQIVDRMQSLVKPSRPMGEEVINIHHITNEMVFSAPSPDQVIPNFHKFILDSIPIAHHAPFDMGFLAWEFEQRGLALPTNESLCTALISRKALPSSPNHRLQTLIQFLNLPQGQAHRALDDAEACLQVALRCFQAVGEDLKLEDLFEFQETNLSWKNYSIEDLCEREAYHNLVTAIRGHKVVEMVYQGGSRPGKGRELEPVGIVRNPNGDFLVGREPGQPQTKRFFLSQISSAKLLY